MELNNTEAENENNNMQQDDTKTPESALPPVEETLVDDSQVMQAQQQYMPPVQPYYTYPGERPRQRKGSSIGCWLTVLLTAFVVTCLALVGLFLPPVSLGDRLFGTHFTLLSSQSNAVPKDGLTLIVDPANPGTEFGVALDAVAMDSFLSADTGAASWVVESKRTLEPFLALQSPVYRIETTGTAPDSVTFTIALPASLNNRDVLDVYAWNQAAAKWYFVPSQYTEDNQKLVRVSKVPDGIAIFQASSPAPVILTNLDTTQNIRSDITGLVSIVSPIGMQPTLPTETQRTLTGNPAPGFETRGAYKVMPTIRNFTDSRALDPDTVVSLIGNRELRDEHVQELTAFALAGRYDGVMIDYRGIDAEHRENFTLFITALSQSMHAVNLSLGVIVPQADNVNGAWQTWAYDWRELGAVVDYLQINFGLDPTTFAAGSDRLVEALLRWAVGEVSRYKIMIGLSALSLQQAGGDFTTIGFNDALANLGDVNIDVNKSSGGTVAPGSEIRLSLDGLEAVPGVDTTIQSPFIDYLMEDGSLMSRVWLTTGDSLRFRMDYILPFALGGVAFSDLLNRGVAADVLEAVTNFKLQLPSPASQSELVLNWRVESAAGKITEFTTGFNEEVVVTLNAPDGNYAVNVDVQGGSLSSARGGAAVALFAPTITPTPLPTATPTLVPTATPTLAPILPTEVGQGAPVAGQAAPTLIPRGPNPVAPGAGSIALGGFEYGGHVTSTGSERAINAMRGAGMNWMKVQIRWSTGSGTGDAQAAIEAAHGNGFKVLVGLVGLPQQVAVNPDSYINEFAAFAGGVAALGPDAIEIWNEPNLAREWPEGHISGGEYTRLLSAAYNAIKATNPGVIVISAALAPTGAEAAFPGQVVNDDNFLRQMVEAGALGAADCVGMHYNEGIVSAYATSGDPRDNYYTRYLPSMIDVYSSITGGQRPICITELGYLSPEGLGQLDGFWAWASNVTVAQQATWLAEAAAYASQSGRVRLMIVWNVDFQIYGSDPMAGYAIVRPGGDCPACAALSGAR